MKIINCNDENKQQLINSVVTWSQ